MPHEFHENMVIWKDFESAWNGIGFFGQSRHGKTPLSFAFAYVLFANGMREIKLFDDCFKIENDRIRQCRVWGRRDQLGETYYTKLAERMSESGHSINELEPGDHSYLLRNVAAYLLIADSAVPFRKQRCNREEFVEALMPTNPFTWDDPKPGKDVVFQRFKSSWMYYVIYRQRKTSQELIEFLTKEASEDTKAWRKKNS
jgi:hypothetical protein